MTATTDQTQIQIQTTTQIEPAPGYTIVARGVVHGRPMVIEIETPRTREEWVQAAHDARWSHMKNSDPEWASIKEAAYMRLQGRL